LKLGVDNCCHNVNSVAKNKCSKSFFFSIICIFILIDLNMKLIFAFALVIMVVTAQEGKKPPFKCDEAIGVAHGVIYAF